jgi:hypothetical protein
MSPETAAKSCTSRKLRVRLTLAVSPMLDFVEATILKGFACHVLLCLKGDEGLRLATAGSRRATE